MWQHYFGLAKEKFYTGCYLVKGFTFALGSTLIETLDSSHTARNYLYDVAAQVKEGATHALSPDTFNRLQQFGSPYRILHTSMVRNALVMIGPAILLEWYRQWIDENHEESHHDWYAVSFNHSLLYVIPSYILFCRWLQMQRNNSLYYNQAINYEMSEQMPARIKNETCSHSEHNGYTSVRADINSLIYFIGDLAILLGIEQTVLLAEIVARYAGLLEENETLRYHHAIFASTFLLRSYVYGKAFLEYRAAVSGQVCTEDRENKLLKNNPYSLVYGAEYLALNSLFSGLTEAVGMGNAYTSAVFASLAYQYFMVSALLIDRLPGAHTGIDWLKPNHLLIDKAVETGSAYILQRLQNKTSKINWYDAACSSYFRFAVMALFFEDIRDVDTLVREPAFHYFLLAKKQQINTAIDAIQPYRERGPWSWFNLRTWATFIVANIPMPEKYQNLQKLVSALRSDKMDEVITTVKKLFDAMDKYTNSLPTIITKHGELSIGMIDHDYFSDPLKIQDQNKNTALPAEPDAMGIPKEGEHSEGAQGARFSPVGARHTNKEVLETTKIETSAEPLGETQGETLSKKRIDSASQLIESCDDVEFVLMPTSVKTPRASSSLFSIRDEDYFGSNIKTQPVKPKINRVPTPSLSDEEGWEDVKRLDERPTRVSDVKASLWQQPRDDAPMRNRRALPPLKRQ